MIRAELDAVLSRPRYGRRTKPAESDDTWPADAIVRSSERLWLGRKMFSISDMWKGHPSTDWQLLRQQTVCVI